MSAVVKLEVPYEKDGESHAVAGQCAGNMTF